jgi:transcriptional regulator with XRE-family HTH domain
VVTKISNMANDNVELLRLGRRIQAERKILGFSQNGFARDCGLNRSYLGGVERGERNLTFGILCKICSGLHCDIANVTRGIPRMSYMGVIEDAS